jgi:GTP cyclohydrolase II
MASQPQPQADAQAERARSLESTARAIAELRRGGTIVVTAENGDAVLARAAETIENWPPAFFSSTGVETMALAVTGRRAAVLGLGEPTAPCVLLRSDGAFSLENLSALIDPATENVRLPPPGVRADVAADKSAATAAVRLAKIARLLPAVLTAPLANALSWARTADRVVVSAAAIEAYDRDTADDLRMMSEAHVPLEGCADTRIISFRPRDGGAEHLAIIIGQPDADKPLLVRLHSECLTGDLLGSLRCDCGDQLRGAVETIAQQGGGAILYLAQEGRGIGLVNKLRAYALQDRGFDTVDANEQLGFDDDERVYLPAVRMLRALGYERVRLLTNNPAKVGALARHGITVTERVAHAFAPNPHNRAYLQAKAKRSGHLL